MVINDRDRECADEFNLFCRDQLEATFWEGMFVPGAIEPNVHADRETVHGNRFVPFVLRSFSEFPSHWFFDGTMLLSTSGRPLKNCRLSLGTQLPAYLRSRLKQAGW